MAETLKTMRISIISALNEMENRGNVMVCMMLGRTKQLIEDLDQWREMVGAMVKAMRSSGEVAQMAATGGLGSGMLGGKGCATLGDAFGGNNAGMLAGLDDLSEDD